MVSSDDDMILAVSICIGGYFQSFEGNFTYIDFELVLFDFYLFCPEDCYSFSKGFKTHFFRCIEVIVIAIMKTNKGLGKDERQHLLDKRKVEQDKVTVLRTKGCRNIIMIGLASPGGQQQSSIQPYSQILLNSNYPPCPLSTMTPNHFLIPVWQAPKIHPATLKTVSHEFVLMSIAHSLWEICAIPVDLIVRFVKRG